MPFNPTHLRNLNEIGRKTPQTWVGTSPISWATSVVAKTPNLDVDLARFGEKKLGREDLYELGANPNVPDLYFSICVLAWGGMRRDHGANCLIDFEKWQSIVRDLRAGSLNRQDAYKYFMELRLAGQLKGMGPAFFTKLIFFGGKSHDGYIMDQWTARSANALLDTSLVDLNKVGSAAYVSDRNDDHIYEKFCCMIEELTREVEFTNDPKVTEETIFSNGGKNKGAWRTYLLDNEL